MTNGKAIRYENQAEKRCNPELPIQPRLALACWQHHCAILLP